MRRKTVGKINTATPLATRSKDGILTRFVCTPFDIFHNGYRIAPQCVIPKSWRSQFCAAYRPNTDCLPPQRHPTRHFAYHARSACETRCWIVPAIIAYSRIPATKKARLSGETGLQQKYQEGSTKHRPVEKTLTPHGNAQSRRWPRPPLQQEKLRFLLRIPCEKHPASTLPRIGGEPPAKVFCLSCVRTERSES